MSGSSRMPGVVSSVQSRGLGCCTSFVAAVSQVGVHGPRLRLCRGDGNAVLLGIVQQILPALEAVAELGQPPRRNDLDGGLQCVEGQLEADLVVALAGAAMRDEATALLLSDADLGAGDDRAGKRGAQQVAALVGGVTLHGAEAQLLDELLLQVENDHLQRANLERLLLHLVPRLLLAHVGEEAHDLISFLLEVVSLISGNNCNVCRTNQPFEDGRGIETACESGQ